jgi:hypothetical protein
MHVFGLGLLGQRTLRIAGYILDHRLPRAAFVVSVGATTLVATCLHGIEASIWAGAYWLLGALPDVRSSALYSLEAMTSYGHASLSLEPHWQLMGALEALNGWLLFGLTAAFLFAVVEKVWSLSNREGGSSKKTSDLA